LILNCLIGTLKSYSAGKIILRTERERKSFAFKVVIKKRNMLV